MGIDGRYEVFFFVYYFLPFIIWCFFPQNQKFYIFIIFINISLIIKVKCKKKYMAASYIVVYIFFTAEIFSIVPLLNKFFPINIYLIFSWLFRDTIISYLVIAGWISVTYYLGRKSSKNMDVL